MRLGLLLLALGCTRAAPNPMPATGSPQAAVEELLAADRAFAAASARTDLVSGLAPMFAADVVMPVPGQGMAMGAAKAVEALRAECELSLAPMPPALPPRMVRPAADGALTAGYREELDRTERAFSDLAQRAGLGPAFAHYGSADAVNMGGPTDTAFIVGAEAIGRAVSAGGPPTGSPVSWAPERVIVASSGDLGITIGTIRLNAPPAGAGAAGAAGIPFFTIWRRASPREEWRYVAE